MNRKRIFLVASLLALTLGLGACATVNPDIVTIGAKLSAASEVPPNSSPATGTLEGSFDKQTSTLSWTLTYSGLSGPARAGHFHGPAAAGSNAGVALGFTGGVESPVKGSAKLTPAQAADLLAGKWYVNLHTALNPGGEIRGQVSVNP
jgi:hypothetical protein